MSVFGRNGMGEFDCFCWGHGKSGWRFVLYIVICNKVHRQLRWYIDTLNIVFTFLYMQYFMIVITILVLFKVLNVLTSRAAMFV